MPHIQAFLKKGSGDYILPPHLPKEQIDQLPFTPGVYYFHDSKDKIIYVGKARNLRYRVKSHFTTNNPGRQRQEFLRNIHRISFKDCPTELTAFVTESLEIKRLWPKFNNAQKRAVRQFGIYQYTDQSGYTRLLIDRYRRNLQPVYTFTIKNEGHVLLQQLVKEHSLCPKLSHIQIDEEACVGRMEKYCKGACEKKEQVEKYNRRVEKAIAALQNDLPSFAIVDKGLLAGKNSFVLMEQGRFYGMGEIPASFEIEGLESIKHQVKPFPDNEHIRSIVMAFAQKEPEKVMSF
jgi:DNA polymerase-3 subunit epsilon